MNLEIFVAYLAYALQSASNIVLLFTDGSSQHVIAAYL